MLVEDIIKKDDYNKTDENKGIDKDVSISGVSLNWMMSKIKNHAPEYANVFENPLGYVHDARNGELKYKLKLRIEILTQIYKEKSRHDKQSNNKEAKLRIHDSVFKRLSMTSAERKKWAMIQNGMKIRHSKAVLRLTKIVIHMCL